MMVANRTKKDQAYQAMRREIISGTLAPGEILNIDLLAERYRLGKTPVREALIVLAAERLVEPLPRTGFAIAPITVPDVLESFHLRTILEMEAAALAAERATPDDIAALEANNLAEREEARGAAGRPDYKRSFDLNREFHLIIATAAGNRRLVRLLEQLLDEMERLLATDPVIADPAQHLDILAALKGRDSAAAREAMRQHLAQTRTRILSRF